nr:hypothetical protein [Cyanidioschyzonaceae sp. 2]
MDKKKIWDRSNLDQLAKQLAEKDFLSANQTTYKLMCKLAGCEEREWIYFTEIAHIPKEAIQEMDEMWQNYSQGKFGFGVQRRIWLGKQKDWMKFWEHIGWVKQGKWLRYPKEFEWSLQAPEGHLPLWNQIRGVQALEELFKHDVWLSVKNVQINK